MSTERVLEACARRAAKRAGLVARKGRGHLSLNNHGGFMLVDPFRNRIVAGEKFDLSAGEIIEYCKTT